MTKLLLCIRCLSYFAFSFWLLCLPHKQAGLLSFAAKNIGSRSFPRTPFPLMRPIDCDSVERTGQRTDGPNGRTFAEVVTGKQPAATQATDAT